MQKQVMLLAPKAQRGGLDATVQELVDVGKVLRIHFTSSQA
jgi:hypothetical protein